MGTKVVPTPFNRTEVVKLLCAECITFGFGTYMTGTESVMDCPARGICRAHSQPDNQTLATLQRYFPLQEEHLVTEDEIKQQQKKRAQEAKKAREAAQSNKNNNAEEDSKQQQKQKKQKKNRRRNKTRTEEEETEQGPLTWSPSAHYLCLIDFVNRHGKAQPIVLQREAPCNRIKHLWKGNNGKPGGTHSADILEFKLIMLSLFLCISVNISHK